MKIQNHVRMSECFNQIYLVLSVLVATNICAMHTSTHTPAGCPLDELLRTEEPVPDVEVGVLALGGGAGILVLIAAPAQKDLGQEILWNLDMSHLGVGMVVTEGDFSILTGRHHRNNLSI